EEILLKTSLPPYKKPSVQKLRTGKRLSPTGLKSLKILFAVVFEAKHLQLHALFLTGFGASLPPVLSSDVAQALLGLVVVDPLLGHRVIVSCTASIASHIAIPVFAPTHASIARLEGA